MSLLKLKTYKDKRNWLLTLIGCLFIYIFYRGIALDLDKTATERLKYHAIPVALSVLYHNHPHDYTGLKAIETPFQGPTDTQQLIDAAKDQVVTDTEPYYWVADDKGFEDYVLTAFYLFGFNLTSLYYMWFLILSVSIGLFLVSFGRSISALAILTLSLLSIQIAIPTFPLVATGIFEPKFLDILAFIAVMHMFLFSFRRQPIQLWKDAIPLFGQLFIFLALYHSRSSLGWEIFAILSASTTICCLRFIKKYREDRGIHRALRFSNIQSSLLVALGLCVGLVGLNEYKHATYNKAYFEEMGTRTFWHNALMGLSQENPYLKNKYQLEVGDYVIASDVIKYAQTTGQCTPDIAKLEPQQLLNTLGGYGVANWLNYEKCAKSLYFSIILDNKIAVFYQYAILKPLGSLRVLMSTIIKPNQTGSNQRNIMHRIGWHPFDIINILIFSLILLASFSHLAKIQRKLLVLSFFILVFSLTPSVAFYSGILTIGGMMVASGLLLYTILFLCIHLLYRRVKRTKVCKVESQFPLNQKKLSILIPAYNEEKRIRTTIQEAYAVASRTLDEFEIIVVDDGSTDATYSVAQTAAHEMTPSINVFSQTTNQGVGAAFQFGLKNAKYPQLCLIPGDNAYNISGIETLFSQCGLFPLVISYRQNMEARTPVRHLLSRMATMSLRLVSGINVRDAHSLFLFPVAETRSLGIHSAGYSYHIEILSRLLKQAKSYTEVPVLLNPKPDASSGVMKPKTLLTLGITILKLIGLRILGKL